jgi:prepilin peptidase CpaA
MMSYLLIVFILLAFITDARHSIIPNKLTLSAAAAGVLGHSIFDGWQGFIYAISGLIAGFIIMLLLYVFGALGAGDVKLFAAVGALTGVTFVWSSMMYSVVYAGVIGVLLLIWQRRLTATATKLHQYLIAIIAFKDLSTVRTMKKRDDHLRFPFMYAVLPGVATAWLYSMI